MIKSIVRHSLIKKGVTTLEVRGAVGVPSTNGNASGSFYSQILSKKGKGKACVIRRLGGIGDVLMCTPTLRQIKLDFPDLELTFAIDMHSTGGNIYYELVKNAAFIDKIIDARYVEHSHYDAVVDISSVCIRYEHSNLPVLNRIEIFARAAGIPRLVDKRSWYQVEDTERQWAKKFIRTACGEGKVVVLHTASMEAKRCWPVKKYIQIIEEALNEGLECKFLVLDFNRTFNNWTQYSNCVDVSFTNLRQMAALIEAADFFIGPDSGPMHLAGALGTKSCVAFGSIDPSARINHYPTHEAIRMSSMSCIGCFHPDEPVVTPTGISRMIDLKIGDQLYDRLGTIQTVEKTYEHENDHQLLSVVCAGSNIPIMITDNHEVPCIQSNKGRKIQRRKRVKMFEERKPIGELQVGDYLFLPKIELSGTGILEIEKTNHHSAIKIPTTLKLDYDLAWFCGMFIAEGCSPTGVIQFTTHENETEIQQRLLNIGKQYFGLEGKAVTQNSCKAVDVKFCSATLARSFKAYFGDGAHNKRLPLEIIPNDLDVVRGFLDGLLTGDGYSNETSTVLGTVSKTLAYQVRSLGLLLGQVPKLYYREKHTNYGYCQYYRVEFCTTQTAEKMKRTEMILAYNDICARCIKTDTGFWIPIKTIKEVSYDGLVYNFTVSNSHSYNVHGIGVYNCWYKPCSYNMKCMTELDFKLAYTKMKKRLYG